MRQFLYKTTNYDEKGFSKITYHDIDYELRIFIKNFTPIGWTEPIGTCCHIPFTWEYYKGTEIPWYIRQAVEAFKKEKVL